MSPPRQILAGAAALGALAGCAQPAAPPGTGGLGAGPVAELGVGAAAGAVLGDKLGGNAGAFIGGAAGLAGTAWLARGAPDATVQEAAEAARREERRKIMRQYWYEQTEAGTGGAGSGAEAGLPLHYPAGAYAGMNFAARDTAEAPLAEPER